MFETKLQWRGVGDRRATLNGNSFPARCKALLKLLPKGSVIEVKFANLAEPISFYRNRQAQSHPSYYSVNEMPDVMPRPFVGDYKDVHIEWVQFPTGTQISN